jgi:hypothetical protein
MSKKCCGAQRETAFCPDCGAQLAKNAAPLVSLIGMLRTQQRTCEKRVAKKVEQYKAWIAETPTLEALKPDIKATRFNTESLQKRADKWKRWADAVEQAMQKDADCESQNV